MKPKTGTSEMQENKQKKKTRKKAPTPHPPKNLRRTPSQLLQRIQQRAAHGPLRARGLAGGSARTSTSLLARASTSLLTCRSSLASCRALARSSALAGARTSRLRQEHGPLADNVADRERELVLVGLELELALAEHEGLGVGAEAADLAGRDVGCAWWFYSR